MKAFLQRLRNISIKKKLYFIVGTMAVLIAIELFVLWFAINTLSAVRACVGAEGLWSKAQKDGVYYLGKYARTHDEADYAAFLNFMKVPLGDHKTRMELIKPEPDFDIARQGFKEGRIHPNDIDGMIGLLRNFHNIYYIAKALEYWTNGDSLVVTQLIPLGQKIHAEIIEKSNPSETLTMLINELDPVNARLTEQEDNFSFILGEGSRWLERIILKILLSVALTVEITGLLLSVSVSRGITRGLNEINRATLKIKKGDLSERALVFSADEIGQVAMAMNQMTGQLVKSNKELAQFAYITSHDLQEPLRTITNYADLFKRNYAGKLDKNGDKYLDSLSNATLRMQQLIKGVLDYSRIGHDKKLQLTDCNAVVQEVLHDMSALVKETHTTVQVGNLPDIMAFFELHSMFRNLISNAIKFRKTGTPIIIHIEAQELPNEWLFSVKDNGIGIEPQYFERIFTIFQRLHSQKEYAGAGIGLAHCLKIAELHGGKIWVESESGKGSDFYFTISKNITI